MYSCSYVRSCVLLRLFIQVSSYLCGCASLLPSSTSIARTRTSFGGGGGFRSGMVVAVFG